MNLVCKRSLFLIARRHTKEVEISVWIEQIQNEMLLKLSLNTNSDVHSVVDGMKWSNNLYYLQNEQDFLQCCLTYSSVWHKFNHPGQYLSESTQVVFCGVVWFFPDVTLRVG